MCVAVFVAVCVAVRVAVCVAVVHHGGQEGMGWLRLVGSLEL